MRPIWSTNIPSHKTYDFSSKGKFAGTNTKSSVSSGLSVNEGGGEGGLGATGDTPSSTENKLQIFLIKTTLKRKVFLVLKSKIAFFTWFINDRRRRS